MDVRRVFRGVWASAWVGWEAESNWTKPFIFIGLQVIRPLASTMLFPLLYIVGMNLTGQPIDTQYLTYIFIGTAFLTPYVFAAESGSQTVSQDRERYGVLKSIYITPSSLRIYYAGRFLGVAAVSVVSTTASILISYIFLRNIVGVDLQISLKYHVGFFVALGCIYAGAFAIYNILVSINLLTNKLHWSLSYYFLGLLYLFGEVLFPASTISPYAEPLTHLLPINPALNTLRSSLGMQMQNSIDGAIVASTLWVVLGAAVFTRAVKQARAKGLLDKVGWW